MQTVVTLCLASELSVGRVGSCDHVAQFTPRNPRNDQRTCMISREHLRLKSIDGALQLVELADVNQSFIGGVPLTGKVKLGSFTRVGVAGEYELDIRRLATWWPVGQLWENQTVASDPSGALLLSPMSGVPALDMETLWLFTDAAFGIEQNGALDLQPSSTRDVIGWFVRDGKTAHIVTAESDGVVRLNGDSLQAMHPRPLKAGDVLRVGAVELELAN